MSSIFYYLVIKPLSFLPFNVLYGISDVLFFLIYHATGYRRSVVHKNLANSFPDKSKEEIRRIEKAFFIHLCDIIVESVKLFSISLTDLRERFTIRNPEILDKYYNNGQSIILVGGHYNNWEYAAISLDLQVPHQAIGIYSPMSNKFFDKKFAESRTKYGVQIVPKSEVRQSFSRNANNLTMTIFGADQSPTYSKRVHWTTFLNQDTAVHVGTELFARIYKYPVFFIEVHKLKRGYYVADLVLLAERPQDFKSEELTKLHTAHLEKMIIEKPEFWLWSHKRWKRKKSEEENDKETVSPI